MQLGNELVWRWIERELGEMAQRFGDDVMVEGQRYRRHAEGTRRYHTLCGPVDVRRASYRLVGVHNGPTVVPLEKVEPTIRSEEPLVGRAHSISLGFDRTTVPMAEPAATPTKRRRRTPYLRRSPPAVTVAYRMAYVGTVSVHDNEGTVVMTKRFAATPSQGPDEIVDRVADEVHHLRSRYGRLPVTVVQDGAPELWDWSCT